MIERRDIYRAITTLETQPAPFEPEIIDITLQALRQQLALLEHQEATDSALHGERRQVTVMFADISGFTAMSEKLDPEEVRNMINACFERLGAVVEYYGGHIDKFIGDEIMALFGAPRAHENDPERALRAALEMMSELDAFNVEHAHKIPKPLALHFGINTGLAIAGGIGTSKRQDYSVMGDTVNLAARLEDKSEAGEILVGEDTYRFTASFFEFETLEPVKLKGKAQPVQVYRLLKAKVSPGGQVRGLEGLFSPLVGRQQEVEQLQTAQARLQKGQGALISIIAEAGLGKSRLVNEFHQACQEDSLQWAKGRALSYAQNASYLIVRQVLRSLLSLEPEASAVEFAQILQEDVARLFPQQSAEIYPYLAHLLELPLNEEAAQRVRYLEGEMLRRRLWQSVKSYIAAKSAQIPLILIWDDLHWADPSSLEILEALLPLTNEHRLLLLLMYRPRHDSRIWTFHERAGQLIGEQHICLELPPLNPVESNQLLNNLLGVCPLPEEIRQLILSKAEGNPFYIEEVIRALLNSGALRLSGPGDDCVVAAEVKDIAIPDTLQGVIMSRVDQLLPDAKRVLQVASVVGRTFSSEVMTRILGETDELTARLQSLETQDLISSRRDSNGLEYKFKHVFTQESVYQSMLRTDRRQLHQKVGEAFEAILNGKVNEQALMLAYHFEESEDQERALKYLDIAAHNAFTAYANQEARDLLSRALALLDKNDYTRRWDLLSRREQVLDRLGLRDQQATDLTLMQTLAELMQDYHRLTITHNRRAAYFDKISEYQAADEAAAVGLRTGRRTNDVHLEAESLNLLALAAWRRFDYRQVQQWAGQALDALKFAGDPKTRITSLLHLGRASYRLGQYDTALEYIRGAQEIANEIDNRENDALADLIFGWIYQRLGVYDQAEQHYQLVLEKRRRIGDRYGEATALSHLGWLAADRHAYDQGLVYCQEALVISQTINDRENEAYALSGLAINYEGLGRFETATTFYQQALILHREIGATTLAIFDQAGLARLALKTHHQAEAGQHITKVVEWIMAGNAQQFWDPWAIYLSAYQVLHALGQQEPAGKILTEAYNLLHQRAKEISNDKLRSHFFHNVEVNRSLEEAWQALSVKT